MAVSSRSHTCILVRRGSEGHHGPVDNNIRQNPKERCRKKAVWKDMRELSPPPPSRRRLRPLGCPPYKGAMHITLVDDSIPFDGFSPSNRPLGGAEKAFVSLAGALARRGHDVHVFNRAHYGMVIEGATWETLAKPFPAQTGALIAFRKPSLLGSVRLADTRLLWATASGPQLKPARKALESFQPVIVLQGATQRMSFDNADGLALRVVPPGLRPDFLTDTAQAESDPVPTAVVTTHPAHDLSWLLDLWVGRVHPAVPQARLLVLSNVLHKGRNGAETPDALRPVLEQAVAAAGAGVEIMAPLADAGMAALYRKARVHLYPGHPDDMVCWTLMESQACGLPAVARDLGAVRERIRDGQTGQVVPDADAFANLAARLLTDDALFQGMRHDALLLQRERSWDVAAAEFESLIKAGAKA